MRTAIIRNIVLVFDVKEGAIDEIVSAIDLINLALQREPYELAAQITYDSKDLAWEVEDQEANETP